MSHLRISFEPNVPCISISSPYVCPLILYISLVYHFHLPYLGYIKHVVSIKVYIFILDRIKGRSCMQGKLWMDVLFGNKCMHASITYGKSCMQNLMSLNPRGINEKPARCPKHFTHIYRETHTRLYTDPPEKKPTPRSNRRRGRSPRPTGAAAAPRAQPAATRCTPASNQKSGRNSSPNLGAIVLHTLPRTTAPPTGRRRPPRSALATAPPQPPSAGLPHLLPSSSTPDGRHGRGRELAGFLAPIAGATTHRRRRSIQAVQLLRLRPCTSACVSACHTLQLSPLRGAMHSLCTCRPQHLSSSSQLSPMSCAKSCS
nr:uncharacterized protein LOC120966201 [Aegilops tauschii subsp. strangulata]XP_045085644.1 uncharacterized protein LOC120966201 [Aegilops tauschii subsp. strangulata]